MRLSGEFARNSCRSTDAARACRLSVPFTGFRPVSRILVRAHVAGDGRATWTVRFWRLLPDCPETCNSGSAETGGANMAGARPVADAWKTVTPAGRGRGTAPAQATAVHRQVTEGIAEHGQSVFGKRSCGAPGFACIRPGGVAVRGGKVQGSVVVSLRPDAGTGRVPMTLGRPAPKRSSAGKE